MWSKIVVLLATALMLIKAFFPSRWKELKAKVDLGVNIMLVLLFVGYALALTIRFWEKT